MDAQEMQEEIKRRVEEIRKSFKVEDVEGQDVFLLPLELGKAAEIMGIPVIFRQEE